VLSASIMLSWLKLGFQLPAARIVSCDVVKKPGGAHGITGVLLGLIVSEKSYTLAIERRFTALYVKMRPNE
jgi:hypothetical protein